MISVRKATSEDIDPSNLMLLRIQDEFRIKHINMWQKGYPDRDSIARDVDMGEAYVADNDGKVVGYMFIHYGTEEFQSTLRGNWNDSRCTVMHRLLTDPDHRGEGIGTLLIEYWERKSRDLGYTSMRTETDETNLPMRGLMRKCGFSELGFLTFDNSDKLAFEKLL